MMMIVTWLHCVPAKNHHCRLPYLVNAYDCGRLAYTGAGEPVQECATRLVTLP